MTNRDWRRRHLGVAFVLVSACLLVAGCSGDDGLDGEAGADSAVLSGRVTNAKTGAGLGTATLTLSPSLPGVTIPVDGSGYYSVELPVGSYALTAAAGSDYVSKTESVSILAGVDKALNIGLNPTVNVEVSINTIATPSPGDSFVVAATVTRWDGSTGASYVWSQGNSVEIDIDNPNSPNPTITLASPSIYKQYLLDHLHTGDLDRWQVMAINPHAYESAANFELHCKVTTSSGTYEDDVEVHVNLDFAAWTLGINNVPVRVPVLLGGRDQNTYNWSLATPGGSSATLMDNMTRYPYFTPDEPGEYVVSVSDTGEDENVSWSIYAGEYRGIIVGQEPGEPGKPTIPVADSTCKLCHSGVIEDWRRTGHAHIFSTQIDTSTHYSPSCFPCHTVGYGTGAEGIDDQEDYDDFLAKDYFHHSPGDNWSEVLEDEPDTAQLANIQCENCHGPQNSDGHDSEPHSRTSLASEVCGSCHGEPPRHGRYQQWEESAHANYETAIGEGWEDEGVRSCSVCHTANGFLYWGENGGWDAEEDDVPPDLVSGPGQLHPITCVVCHDPHNVGDVSGEANNAPLRKEGDTPYLMAGFEVYRVGKGATCMICHNGRRGLRNDENWEGISDRDRAPHLGPQTDVLVGENAYFVETGWRSVHSLLEDTCVTCHVELTPPPPDLSYNLGGTNHTFEAKESICGDCHGEFTADNLHDLVEFALEGMHEYIAHLIVAEIDYQVWWNENGVYLRGYVADGEGQDRMYVTIEDVGEVDYVELVEWHGRQAMHVHLDGGPTVYNVRLASDDTAVYPLGGEPEPGDDPALVDSYGGQILARAGWNMYLLHADGSHGIHNPEFVQEIIQETFRELEHLEDWYDGHWFE